MPIGNKISKTGATAWAKSGRYTGITDVELTPEGAAQVASTAATLVGSGKVLDPSRITRVFVSPRKRARRTFELLLPLPSSGVVDWEEKVTYTEGIAEWNYGDYEGLKVGEIRELRRTRWLDKKRKWDIWKDECEGGEYVVLHLLIPPTRTATYYSRNPRGVPFPLICLQIYAAGHSAVDHADLANSRDPTTVYERKAAC